MRKQEEQNGWLAMVEEQDFEVEEEVRQENAKTYQWLNAVERFEDSTLQEIVCFIDTGRGARGSEKRSVLKRVAGKLRRDYAVPDSETAWSGKQTAVWGTAWLSLLINYLLLIDFPPAISTNSLNLRHIANAVRWDKISRSYRHSCNLFLWELVNIACWV